MDKRNQVIKLILLATDAGTTEEESRTAAIQACKIIREHALIISEPQVNYMDYEISALKQRGNEFIVDKENDRILVKSTNEDKKYRAYIYYPSILKWICSTSPDKKYSAQGIDQFLDKFVNSK